MLADLRIAFIGAGNMAEAMIAGLLHAKLIHPARLVASDIVPRRLDWLKRTYGVETTGSNRDAVAGAQILVLAVEPQILDEVLRELAPIVDSGVLIVSVAAGYPIARIARHLNGVTRIVRAMPNTPSIIRQGVTALAHQTGLADQDLAITRTIFEAIGTVVLVGERSMDVVTGLSGSGPAYVYVMIEALADGGVKMGLPRETAQLLAAQTVAGAARLVMESHEHPGALKDRVASPGGTTIAGLHELERGCFRATLISAVEAASRRSAELGMVS
jgi:pyrroline-5-carboxylate reductase